MRFAPSDEQRELEAVVRQVLTERCPPETVRAGAGSARVASLAESLAGLGVAGLLVAEDDGGLGLDESHLVSVFAQIGYAAAPLPLAATLAVAPAVLVAGAPDLLARLVEGSLTVGADPAVTGRVAFGSGVDLVLSGGFGGTGRIEVLDVSEATASASPSVDFALDLTGYAGARLVATVDDPQVVRLAWERGVLAASAELIGLSRRMLDLTVEHVRTREQFGVPIGSFQAVKHHLATALLQLEFAAPVVATAGFELAAGVPGRLRSLATAKALASEAAHVVGRAALQCHGAIGYTTEYDLQLFLKRSWALESSWGSSAWHRAALLEDLGVGLTGARPAS
ncbi:acyl-CoA dehydrogenase family protein [Micromonospora sp. DT178]|uniref:acyl-CoA dehydrogenase family protein n=1 Tax=Micromonospora sp. DT178 TaxID=3393436 RepID=UPI003CEBBEA8